MTASPSRVLLPFDGDCLQAVFLRREKRFRVEVETPGGPMWVHTNNSGSMLGLLRAGCPAFISHSHNPRRKLSHTLELLAPYGFWVGVNTMTPNRLLKAAFHAGVMPELQGYKDYKAEAVIGDSRLDARLSGPQGTLYVEAKNVTLVEDDVAAFPDAVTERGQKHLRSLTALAESGVRTALFFCIQRPDAACFGPADYIDPVYADLLHGAMTAGVEVWPYEAIVSPLGVGLGRRLPPSSVLIET